MPSCQIEFEGRRVGSLIAARALLERLPDRACSVFSENIYKRTFVRMWAEKTLDPLRQGDARDTYNQRRAALHWGARQVLQRLLKKLDVAASAGNRELSARLIGIIKEAVDRLGPAIDRDPPQWGAIPDFSQSSRWKTEGKCAKPRGAGSKKHDLGKLPRDWILQMWQGVQPDHKHRDAIAVVSLSPARPGEAVPGDRPSGFSQGIIVALDKKGRLVLANKPLKTHGGKYGMAQSAVKIDVAAEGPIAEYLAQRCRDEGGQFVVKIDSADALSKAIKRVGQRVFPAGPAITAYVYRHQRLADAKAAFGAGEKAALAGGHSTDRTQARYGNICFGRRGGLIGAFGTRQPRLVAVARARELGEARKAHQALNRVPG